MNVRVEPLLNSLWIGGDLPTVHVGCLLSAVKAGAQDAAVLLRTAV
jgi:hypothetical protein